MILNDSKSQKTEVIDLFPQTKKKERKRAEDNKHRILKRKLSEVIIGQRAFLKVHSESLQTDFWVVNEGLVDPADRLFNGKVITMAILAGIMASRQPLLPAFEKLFRDEKRYKV